MKTVPELFNELYINGFAVMEDAIPSSTIDRIHSSFMPMLEHVRQREPEPNDDERGDIRVGCGRHQDPYRYNVQWPWEGGLACPEITENPTLLALLEAYWDADDFLVTGLHSNSPYPGSMYQSWHRDITLMAPRVALDRVPHLGIKFPLVDTNFENGSFEVLPSTQLLSDPSFEGAKGRGYNDIIESGSYPHVSRLNMQCGTLWVQDVRTLHRGTPNRSDGPRPELVINFSQAWAAPLLTNRPGRNFCIGTREFEELSERGRKLFEKATILPDRAAA